MVKQLISFLNRYFVYILTSVFFLRAAYVAVSGLDLMGDESYYWDWSRRLDWCYFSKPPMVAWLIAVFTAIGGDNAVAVRLPAVVLGTVCLSYVYATAKECYSPKAGALSILLLLAMPFNAIANFVMTIDAPLACFWMMSLYYLRRALFVNEGKAWFWAGVWTGAAILSKQVALFIPLLLVVYLLLDKTRRRYCKREFLVYLLPVLISLIPVIYWNFEHNWVMFAHSQSHFVNKEQVALTTRLQEGAVFIGFQLLLATPVIFGMILIVTIKKTGRFTLLTAQEQFLFLMGPVLLIGIIGLSFIQKVQGNWPMPFYLTGVILLSGQNFGGIWRTGLKTALSTGYFMVLLVYGLPLVIQTLKFPSAALDPTGRFRHWRELAHSVDAVRQKILLDDSRDILLITLGHRYLTSQLAFYLPGHPKVYRYEASGQVVSQYEIWDDPAQFTGKTALIVSEQPPPKIPPSLKAAFADFKPAGTIVNSADLKRPYFLFLGEKLTDSLNHYKTYGN